MVSENQRWGEGSIWRGRYARTLWLLAICVLAAETVRAQQPGTWAPSANLTQARAGHTATLLSDGNVLIAGGKDASGRAMPTAEIFDPGTGAYVPAPANLPTAVWGHTATLLNDGTALIAGGE